MLQPLMPNARRQQVAQAEAVPPPIGGLNTRDSLDLMEPQDATRLTNWFPRTRDVILRKGHQVLTTTQMGSGDTVGMLEGLETGSVSKLLAACGGKIYDATAATPSELATGYSADEWQVIRFADLIFGFNGTDAPWTYDGSTFDSTTGFTGPTIANLVQGAVQGERLLLVEKDTMSFWYGGVGSITGALTEFDLKNIANHGGNLNSVHILASDGGQSSRNLVCFFMTSGEVIVYSGTNPGDASAWQLVGSFLLAPPIGRRNAIQVAGDLICITEDGFVPLTQALPFGRARDQQSVMSDKIRGSIEDAVEGYKDNAGWEINFHPLGNMLIFNIPTSTDVFHQYVQNLNTLAWCKFEGLNGYTFTVFNGGLWFGDKDGYVYQADTGRSDNGETVKGDGATAWNYFGDRTREKQFTLARPLMASDGDLTLSLTLNVDFNENAPAYSASSPILGPIWDATIWDASIWGGGSEIAANWFSATNIGFVASLRVRVSTSTLTVKWNSTSYAFVPGAIL